MENKTLKEIYEELYALMKKEKIQDDLKKDLRNLKEAKKFLNEKECFGLLETAGMVQKHIEHINSVITEKNILVNDNFKKESEQKLSTLFEEYLKAVKSENKDGLIKHDIIITMEVEKGYEEHLERMLQYISFKSPINIARKDTNEILITMTSMDFINEFSYIQKKMTDNNTKFEVRTIYPDMKQRTVPEHNDLLKQSDNMYVTDGKYVGYFLNNDRFNMLHSKPKDFIKERFLENYHNAFIIHNKLNQLDNSELYISYQYKVADKSDGRIYNPFTEFEYQEKQSQQNNLANKNKRPKM